MRHHSEPFCGYWSFRKFPSIQISNSNVISATDTIYDDTAIKESIAPADGYIAVSKNIYDVHPQPLSVNAMASTRIAVNIV
jgi:hypothetical protein